MALKLLDMFYFMPDPPAVCQEFIFHGMVKMYGPANYYRYFFSS